jgi:hypothetical protein
VPQLRIEEMPRRIPTGAKLAEMDETALVFLVPEAEALVAAHRMRYDPVAAVGVPAHVTVLYPFRSLVDKNVADVVGGLAAAAPAFDVTFARLARFPGEVLYLVPEPAEPFRLLTEATIQSFPDCPPYGGTVADPIPHLTVADGVDDVTAAALEAELRPGLPISAHSERLTLLAGRGRRRAVGRCPPLAAWPIGSTTPGLTGR